MGDLDLLLRSPEVIDLLMVSAHYLKKKLGYDVLI
jgi:hypothetical protein